MPLGRYAELLRFQQYAACFTRRFFAPLSASDIPSFDGWLDGTGYPGPRKRYLRRLAARVAHTEVKFAWSLAFIKWEGYSESKQPRAINSPSDESKVILGRYISAVDKLCIFALDYFVKKTNPRDWPKLLADRFGVNKVMETDFSSFEAHHVGVLGDVVYDVYQHCLSGCGMPQTHLELMRQLFLGPNKSVFTTCDVTVNRRLMSGALWTSSANGVLNLLLMSYLNLRTVLGPVDAHTMVENFQDVFIGLCEGDDGICVNRDVPESLIHDLGLKLEFSVAENFGAASFCGNLCDPEDLRITTDPVKFLRNFFLIPQKYLQSSRSVHYALLRAKALSYLYLHKHTPIIGPICMWVCRRTRSHNARFDECGWKAEMARGAEREALWHGECVITDRARALMCDRFGIPPNRQLEIERAARGDQMVLNLDDLMSPDDHRLADEFVYPERPEGVFLPPLTFLHDSIAKAAVEGLQPSREWKKGRVAKQAAAQEKRFRNTVGVIEPLVVE
jgi:hypothetical protein